MVYFHGGGFAAGAADEVDGRRLAADNNVVVVSVAYRLGALGFLAHPDMLKEEKEKEGGAVRCLVVLCCIFGGRQSLSVGPSIHFLVALTCLD